MAIVDADGLFSGERLAACGDMAQLYWPRLYLGANGYARLELSYSTIISKIFRNFRKPPEKDDLWSIFHEYEQNCLAILYEPGNRGVWWCEFATSEKWLPRYKTGRDRLSPTPTQEERAKFHEALCAWRLRNRFSYQSFREKSDNFGEVRIGIGEGVGVGKGDGEVQEQKPLRRNKSVADERASPFKEDFGRAFEYANNAPAPWSAKEATNLRNWLVANPTITREQWQKILNNRQRSPINKALSLSVWIGKALSWLNAPADEWGKPISGGHQNGKGTYEKPTTADRQAVELQRSVRDYATAPRANQDGGSALGDGGGPSDSLPDPRSVGADSW